MRPVDRGIAPRNFTDYHQARDPLIAAIGGYCSYCEMPCQFKIEHVLPWENKHISLKLDKLKPDPRVQMRSEAWKVAQIFATDYFAHPTVEKRDLLVLATKGHGFWSVWRTVFAADVDVLNALNQIFAGTDPSCFDVSTATPIARHGGQL